MGQVKEKADLITEIAENLAGDESDPESAVQFAEVMDELAGDPVEINSGDEAELSRLFFLSVFQVKAIIDHTNKTGNIVSEYEIASIPGFDRHTVEMMIPFISLKTTEKNLPEKLRFNNSLITNFALKPGEHDTTMPGSQLKFLTKYKVAAGPFSAGFTTEKDPGEKCFSGSPPLPDFHSSYIAWSGKGALRKIIAGDYSARFGQGTNINTRMSTGISLTAPGYMTGRDEIRPYTSADENNFFRGAATELSFNNIGVSLLFSHRKTDASAAAEDSGELYITSLYRSGLHNTESSIMKKDILPETFFGGNIYLNISPVRIGMTWSESRFSIPLALAGSDPADLYKFNGKRTGVVSAYYNSLVRRIVLYGEISSDYSRDLAVVQGITIRPSDRLQISFLYRDYSPGFVTFHGRGPGSGSSMSDEKGLLGNFTFEAARYFFISAGCDIVRFPWLKYRTGYPSIAMKQEIRLRFVPDDKLSIEASYNLKYSMSDKDVEYGLAGIEERTARTFKAVFRYSPSGNLFVSTRIDYKTTDETGSHGMMLLQEIKYSFRLMPVTIWLRHSVFMTDDWDSRIYAYENDLLHSFSIPALSGDGSRSYIMAEWEIGDKAELRVKYGVTSTTDDSGLTEDKDEIKLQFRFWF
ncbi:MAG: hypothetical protein V1903_07395 [Bacteroidota bacterium]